MKHSNDLITIVTVVFNGEESIEKTIKSVLSQRYANIEYIIVDGMSTDNTFNVISKYKDNISTIICESDSGVYDAMNKAIVRANGVWINFMNCGDTFVSENSVNDLFDSNIDSDIDVIYGDSFYIYSTTEIYVTPEDISMMNSNLPFCHQSAFTKANVLKDNLFDLKFKIAADHNLFFSLCKKNKKFIYIPKPVAKYALEGGLSYKNVLTSFRESAIITHKELSLKYYLTLLGLIVRNWIVAQLPNQAINKFRLRKYKRDSRFRLTQ